MMKVKDEIIFQQPPDVIFNAITNEKIHTEWSKRSVSLSREVGGKCNWYDSMEGEIIEFIENKKLVHTWRADDWPAGHNATVTMKFVKAQRGTKLEFELKNPPPEHKLDEKGWIRGWTVAYWSPIKVYLDE